MELTQPERVADRVKAVFERVAEQVGQWLVRADILDQEYVADTVGQLSVVQSPRRCGLGAGGSLLVGTNPLVEELDKLLTLGWQQLPLVRRWHIPGIDIRSALDPELNALIVGTAAQGTYAEACHRLDVFVARRAMICEQRLIS